MLAKRIIPCLDVMNGRVVKGVNFVDLRDAGDPVEQAIVYDREGADELVFLDITASHEARSTMLDMVRRVADSIFLPFCVGGGIRTIDDIRATLLAGADKVSLNRRCRWVARPGRRLEWSIRVHGDLAVSASSSPSIRSGWAITGKSISMVDVCRPGWMQSNGRGRLSAEEQVKSC